MAYQPIFQNGGVEGMATEPHVDRMLGNAYQVVRYVAQKMHHVQRLSTNMQSLVATSNSLTEVAQVAAVRAEVVALYANLTELVSIYPNMTALLAVQADMAELLAVPVISAEHLRLASLRADAALASEEAALQSAEDASGFADQANATRQAIDNRTYPGTSAVDPLIRPDGTARQIGDRYYNSTTQTYKTFNGTIWFDPETVAIALRNSTETTAKDLRNSVEVTARALRDSTEATAKANRETAANLVLAGIGYAPPVPYITGIALTLATQTVEYAGEVYAPKFADLPFTTSGTFEASKFRLIQGVAGVDLAAAGGAGMVGFKHIGTGAVATTAEAMLANFVFPENFGAIGDGLTHPLSTRYATLALAQVDYPFATALTQEIDYCALQAAITSKTFDLGWYISGPGVYLRDGATYYCGTDTLRLKRYVRIVGSGTGQAGGTPAKIKWAANTRGIEINRYNTLGDIVETTPTTAADGSILEGFSLVGGGGEDTGSTAHGIHMRARATIHRMTVSNFAGNGINVTAASDQSGPGAGNANCFSIVDVRITNCLGHGLYIVGYDANAGHIQSVDASSNALWGIKDDSFLGCSFYTCHSASNGAKNGKTAYATYGGNTYHAVPVATLAQLQAVQPGTNSGVWYPCSATSYAVAWSGSEALGVFRHGGAYNSTNNNARSAFYGCYSEGGQGAVFLSKHSIALGGFFVETPVATGAAIEGRFGTNWSRQAFSSETVIARGDKIAAAIGGADANGRAMFLQWNGASGGAYSGQSAIAAWTYSNSGILYMPGNVSVSAPSSVRPGLTECPHILLGSGGTSRLFGRVTYSTASGIVLPTSGNYYVGDILLAPAPLAGGQIGFVCTVAGVAGSTAVFKNFGAIQA